MSRNVVQEAASKLKQAAHVVVLTGAGVSKESGVPTFRNALEGLWAKYDPQQLATPEAFRQDPKLVWDWYEYRREIVRRARPNPGHRAIARLQRRLPRVTVVTQNVDDLHEQAGSQDVIHLHGSLAENKCSADCQGSPTLIDVSQIEYDPESGPPRCPHCGELVRPNVVWFGEALPPRAFDRARRESIQADVMLVVGTSGLVHPAASLPMYAAQREAMVMEVNPSESAITRLANIKLTGPSGEMLPQVLKAMGDG